MARQSLLKGQNILLVEDEMMVAMLLQSVLEGEGCNVICAGYLEQATFIAQEQALDAVVLDVNLHGQLSYPVADVLVSRGIPFVFSSGYKEINLSLHYPGRPVVVKPYQPDDLISVLSSLITIASHNK